MRYLFNNLYLENYNINNVDEVIKDKINNLINKIDISINEMEFNKVVRMFVDFINWYSSTLTENIKNEFYESGIDSEFRIKYENEFYFILNSLNELLFPILPFLSIEIKKALGEKEKKNI